MARGRNPALSSGGRGQCHLEWDWSNEWGMVEGAKVARERIPAKGGRGWDMHRAYR